MRAEQSPARPRGRQSLEVDPLVDRVVHSRQRMAAAGLGAQLGYAKVN